VVSPPLHPRLIDRYLIAIQNGGAKPLICVNKIDLLEDMTELDVLEPYRKIGIPVIQCSTKDSLGIDELRTLLQGQKVVFVGHSGVGKSSLINAFAPELNLVTGGVSEGYGRGTHTTTVSSLHRLPGDTTLVDTPGIRSFGLWSVTQHEIERSFPEFVSLECKFNDCTHTKEPGCGVLAAVESGAISRDRYSTFLRLRDELG
jgi:ribosome biogenesis GTPase